MQSNSATIGTMVKYNEFGELVKYIYQGPCSQLPALTCEDDLPGLVDVVSIKCHERTRADVSDTSQSIKHCQRYSWNPSGNQKSPAEEYVANLWKGPPGRHQEDGTHLERRADDRGLGKAVFDNMHPQRDNRHK